MVWQALAEAASATSDQGLAGSTFGSSFCPLVSKYKRKKTDRKKERTKKRMNENKNMRTNRLLALFVLVLCASIAFWYVFDTPGVLATP